VTVRRALGVVVGSAVLWATACGHSDSDRSAVLPPASSATTTAPTETAPRVGFPPRLTWWSHGRLHVEEGVIRTPMRQVVARGGTTIVGRSTDHGSHWMIPRELRLTDLFSTRTPGARPVLSANGLHAAWVTSVSAHRYDDLHADTAFTVTAYDVGRGHMTGATVLESRTECCDAGGVIAVAGVDNDGTVILARNADQAWAWRPGRDPVELTGAVRPEGLPGTDQWPGGVSWAVGSSSAGPAAFGRISASGAVTPVGRVPVSQEGLWSRDGTSYAYSPFRKRAQPRPVVWHDGQRQVLRAPRGSSPVAWESPGRVLVVGASDPDTDPIRLWRCRVSDGRCEQAGRPLRHAILPATFAF
jgi:hypothetical protein